ncbi:MAG: hypothetical protein V4532_03115 [Pseudomonadota bacterium]
MTEPNTDPFFVLLLEKQKALTSAEAAVTELRAQIETIKTLKPTQFEQLLKSSANPVESPPLLAQHEHLIKEAPQQEKDGKQAAVAAKKVKGAVSQAIVNVMVDGSVRTIEDALIEVNKVLPEPTTHGSVRSTLGNLKSQGHVVSVGYGKYRIAPEPKQDDLGLPIEEDDSL